MTTSIVYRALDLRFSLEVDDPEVERDLTRAFDCMAVVGESAAVRYRVRTSGPFGVTVDDHEERLLFGRADVVPHLLWRINADVLRTTARPVVHGALVVDAGGSTLICGRSGAGKSTLAAALTASGFAYATDEAVEFGPDGQIRCWTRSLSLGSASLHALDVAGCGLEVPPIAVGANGDHLVPPGALGRVHDGRVPRLRNVLFLTEADDGSLGELGPATGLMELACHLLPPHAADATTLRSASALLASARAWRVPRRPIADLIATVRQISR